MKRNLRFENVYPHPVEKVWRALTDPEALGEWLMKNDFKPELGHKFQFRADPQRGWDGVVDCEVLEIDEPRRLAYSWRGGNLDTKVTYTLEAVGNDTRLILEHTGFTGMKGVMVSFMLGMGWKKKLLRQRLPAVLERVKKSIVPRSVVSRLSVSV